MARRSQANQARRQKTPPLSAPAVSPVPMEPQPVVPRRTDFGKNLVNLLFPAYVLMIALGYGVFLSGMATTRGNEIGSDRSLFHAINAASLTGFPATVGVHEFNGLGQATSLLLMMGGGLFSLIVGGLLPVEDAVVVATRVGPVDVRTVAVQDQPLP